MLLKPESLVVVMTGTPAYKIPETHIIVDK